MRSGEESVPTMTETSVGAAIFESVGLVGVAALGIVVSAAESLLEHAPSDNTNANGVTTLKNVFMTPLFHTETKTELL
jgi:hypothetical protein